MRYHCNKSLLMLLMLIFINIDLYAQNNEQNSGKAYDVIIISKGQGSILCNEQFKVDYEDRKEFTLKNNADVRLSFSPKEGHKLSKFTINGINKLQNIENNRITLKDISRKTVIVATFEIVVSNDSSSTNLNKAKDVIIASQATSTGQKKSSDLNLQQISIGFQQYTLKDFATKDIKSNYGISASYGKTYLMNRTPSKINLGFDVDFAEVLYNNYQLKFKNKTEHYHQIELGVQLGLALVYVPNYSFYGKLYAHYAPRYSMIRANEKWNNSYGNYIVGGVSFHISHFGIGGEFCYGNCKYLKEDNENAPKNTNIGLRVFVSYNF